jgi:hypothetical protein
MKDNKNALFGSAYFDPQDLADKIIEISNKDTISKMIDNLKIDYKERLSLEVFSKRFLHAIN